MNEFGLQLLLVLAFLAIGLLSVTFPIYAICVTYLKQEFWENLKARKVRVEKLKIRVTELAQELSGQKKDSVRFKQIKEQIDKYTDEIGNPKWFSLTAVGAVLMPVTFLLISIVFAVIGLFFYYNEISIDGTAIYPLMAIGSAAGSIVAILLLYRTISAVESAAFREFRTVDYDAFFDKKFAVSKEIVLGEPSELLIHAGTRDVDLEDLIVRIYLPPEIEILGVATDVQSCSYQPEGFDFCGFNMLVSIYDFVPKDFYNGTVVNVKAAKVGTYKLPVWLHAKNAKLFKTELTIVVVEKRDQK